MIDRVHVLPLTRQASLLRLSRSSVYYLPRPVPLTRLAIMHRIDALHLDHPFAGSRMLRDLLRAEGIAIGRMAVATLMRRMGIAPHILGGPRVCQKPLMRRGWRVVALLHLRPLARLGGQLERGLEEVHE